MKNQNNIGGPAPEVSRRKFMAGAGFAAVSFAILKPQQIAGAEANSKIADAFFLGWLPRQTA